MAAVDNVTRMETGDPSEDTVRAQLTGASSTYTSLLSNVRAFHFTVEGTNGATVTRSGSVVTVTGTNDDWVNITCKGDR